MFKQIRPFVKPSTTLTPLACLCNRNFGTTLHSSKSIHQIFQVKDPHYTTKIQESFKRQAFMDFIGAKLVKVEPGFVEIHLPYKKELSQQHGFFHGGVIGALADNSGGYAAFTLLPADATVLAVEYKLNFLTPADGDMLISKGHVIRAGHSLLVSKADVFVVKQGQEKLCASALQTVMGIPGKKDEPGMTSRIT